MHACSAQSLPSCPALWDPMVPMGPYGREEPRELQSTELQRVRHNWSDLAHTCFCRASQVVLVIKNPPFKAGDLKDADSIPKDPLKEGTATHSSTLAWRIPWAEEPGGLQSKGLNRVWYNWSDLACMQTLSKNLLDMREIREDLINWERYYVHGLQDSIQ